MSEPSAIQSEMVDAGGCRRRLSVTVPSDLVAHEYDETLHRYSRAIRIPGFRRGKVPAPIVKKRFAREIEEEVRDHLLRHALQAAIERHEVQPLHSPVVEGDAVKEGEPYSFSALFEVRPKLRLGEYRGLPVSRPDPVIKEEDVDAAIQSIRERLGKFVPVLPRPVAKGDFVLVDLQGQYEDGKGKEFHHEGVMIEVGSESNLQEFESALPGMAIGESRSFTVSYPSEFEAEQFAGRRVRYTLSVKEIKVKELPAADDELPKDIGKQGTLAELREEIRKDLLDGGKKSVERQAKESLLRDLIENHRLDVPEIMVEEQVNRQIEEIVRGMVVRGIHPTKTDIDWKDLREKELPLARQRVLGILILDEIASVEGITASDSEVHTRVLEQARARGERMDEVRKRLEDPSTRQALKNQIVREMSLDFLLNNATIKV